MVRYTFVYFVTSSIISSEVCRNFVVGEVGADWLRAREPSFRGIGLSGSYQSAPERNLQILGGLWNAANVRVNGVGNAVVGTAAAVAGVPAAPSMMGMSPVQPGPVAPVLANVQPIATAAQGSYFRQHNLAQARAALTGAMVNNAQYRHDARNNLIESTHKASVSALEHQKQSLMANMAGTIPAEPGFSQTDYSNAQTDYGMGLTQQDYGMAHSQPQADYGMGLTQQAYGITQSPSQADFGMGLTQQAYGIAHSQPQHGVNETPQHDMGQQPAVYGMVAQPDYGLQPEGYVSKQPVGEQTKYGSSQTQYEMVHTGAAQPAPDYNTVQADYGMVQSAIVAHTKPVVPTQQDYLVAPQRNVGPGRADTSDGSRGVKAQEGLSGESYSNSHTYPDAAPASQDAQAYPGTVQGYPTPQPYAAAQPIYPTPQAFPTTAQGYIPQGYPTTAQAYAAQAYPTPQAYAAAMQGYPSPQVYAPAAAAQQAYPPAQQWAGGLSRLNGVSQNLVKYGMQNDWTMVKSLSDNIAELAEVSSAAASAATAAAEKAAAVKKD